MKKCCPGRLRGRPVPKTESTVNPRMRQKGCLLWWCLMKLLNQVNQVVDYSLKTSLQPLEQIILEGLKVTIFNKGTRNNKAHWTLTNKVYWTALKTSKEHNLENNPVAFHTNHHNVYEILDMHYVRLNYIFQVLITHNLLGFRSDLYGLESQLPFPINRWRIPTLSCSDKYSN